MNRYIYYVVAILLASVSNRLFADNLVEQFALVLTVESEKTISGLIFGEGKVIENAKEAIPDPFLRYVDVTGTFNRKGWELFYKGQAIPLSNLGEFHIRIAAREQTDKYQIVAKGPKGKVEEETIGVALSRELHSDGLRFPSYNHAHFELLTFRLSAFFQIQADDIGAAAPLLEWVPTYWFSDVFGVRADFAGAMINKLTGGSFIQADYQLLLTYFVSKDFFLEAGGGQQDWLGYETAYTMFGFNVGYILPTPLINYPKLAQIIVGYSYVARPVHVQDYRFGVAFEF